MRPVSRFLRCLPLLFLVLVFACNETTEPLDLAGAPAALTVAGGNDQQGLAGTTLPQALVARVLDLSDRPVPGVEVEWSTDAGSLAGVTSESNAQGDATMLLTLPGSTGSVTVTAIVADLDTVTFTATASPVAGQLVFRYVEVGSYHACAITTAEESLCWGFNENGQVSDAAASPLAMTRSPGAATVRMTSAGRYHSCEVTLAGDVNCFGSNSEGQAAPGAPPSRIVAAGLLHSCALSLSKQVWCWGSNSDGQLGNGQVEPGTSGGPDVVGDGYRAVTATGLHTCALNDAGAAECWGWNASGQLGDGSTTTRGSPFAIPGLTFRTEPNTVPPAPDPDFYIPGQSYISAGFAHTCGILTDDAAVCWGEGENGQLGRGSIADSPIAVAVLGGYRYRAISAGYRHTCAITVDGDAHCWGDNALGQLGDGSQVSTLSPVAVAGGFTWQSIGAGDTFSCGVTTGGTLYCWGDNVYGQLGSATPALSPEPLKLPFQP